MPVKLYQPNIYGPLAPDMGKGFDFQQGEYTQDKGLGTTVVLPAEAIRLTTDPTLPLHNVYVYWYNHDLQPATNNTFMQFDILGIRQNATVITIPNVIPGGSGATTRPSGSYFFPAVTNSAFQGGFVIVRTLSVSGEATPPEYVTTSPLALSGQYDSIVLRLTKTENICAVHFIMAVLSSAL